MRKKTKKNKKKFILLFILITIILLIVMYMVRKNRVLPYTDTIYDNTLLQSEPIYQNKEDKKIYPENAYQFIKNYQKTGKANLNDIYNELYDLKENIYILLNENIDNSDEEIKKYYEQNINTKFKKIKFSNLDDFMKFIKEIKYLKEDTITFEKAKFDIDTFVSTTKEYVVCELHYIFTQNHTLIFDCIVSKEKEEILFVYK